MLHELLTAHRIELIDRCKEKAAKRLAPRRCRPGFNTAYRCSWTRSSRRSKSSRRLTPCKAAASPAPRGADPPNRNFFVAAMMHGHELLKGGYSVEQVVHDYGDLCQAITDLAFERHSPVDVDEFQTLNRCLDNGIAHAVTEYESQRDS